MSVIYVFFDHYDTERLNPVKIEGKRKLSKDEEFDLDDVTYRVMKMFKLKSQSHTCVEIKMIRYKIRNSVTSFSHKCPARKGMMDRMTSTDIESLRGKYGKKTVDAWVKDGRIKMKGMSLANVCPDCGCEFWKDQVEIPEKVEVVSTLGKKKLVKVDHE